MAALHDRSTSALKGTWVQGVGSSTDSSDTGVSAAERAALLTYEPYYGLSEKPFSLSTHPRSLYMSPSHAPLFEDLVAAIRRRENLIVLTGEMGTGKTTLCRAAISRLDAKTFTSVVPDPGLSREDLLRGLLIDFGVMSVADLTRGHLHAASRSDLSYLLHEFLASQQAANAYALLVIEEAQRITQPLIDELRALSEVDETRTALQMILIGQPELRMHLKQTQMRLIDQRVTMRYELHPLTREALTGYVAHRLTMAGGSRDRVDFSAAALDAIYDASRGVPRVINLVCERALQKAHNDRTSRIDRAIVRDTIEELGLATDAAPRPAAAATPAALPAATMYEDIAAEPVESDDVEAVSQLFPTEAPAPREVQTGHRGLFERRAAEAGAKPAPQDLNALLDLPVTATPQSSESSGSGRVDPSVPSRWRAAAADVRRRPERTASTRTLSAPLIGVAMMLAGAGAVMLVQWIGTSRGTRDAAPAVMQAGVGGPAVSTIAPQSAATGPTAQVAPMASDRIEGVSTAAASAGSTVANSLSVPTAGEWVVQIAAFESRARAAAMVKRLGEAGFPAHELEGDVAGQRLALVRIGPYATPEDAGAARARVRTVPDFEGAFVMRAGVP